MLSQTRALCSPALTSGAIGGRIELTLGILRSLKGILDKSDTDFDEKEAKNLLIRLRYQDNVDNVCKEWSPGKNIVMQH